VRFLVDDLNLALKDAAPKADASDVSKTPPRPPAEKTGEKKGLIDRAKEKLGLGGAGEAQAPDEAALDEDEFPDDQSAFPDEAGLGAGGVTVSVDKVTLHPGALASGSVTFSDGVTAKWLVDNYGRPGFSEVSQPGYRPSPADAQAFMQELSVALQSRGF
jgi:hypothetical protein